LGTRARALPRDTSHTLCISLPLPVPPAARPPRPRAPAPRPPPHHARSLSCRGMCLLRWPTCARYKLRTFKLRTLAPEGTGRRRHHQRGAWRGGGVGREREGAGLRESLAALVALEGPFARVRALVRDQARGLGKAFPAHVAPGARAGPRRRVLFSTEHWHALVRSSHQTPRVIGARCIFHSSLPSAFRGGAGRTCTGALPSAAACG